MAGNLLLQLSVPESLEELKERASAVCGMPPGLLKFVQDTEPLKSLEDITGDLELMMMVDESPYYSWNIAGNPDSHFLTGSDTTVEFADLKNMSDPDYVNVLSQVPIQQGVHFVEFIMHSLQDEQWCGVTFFASRAGCRGGDVPGCYYYSGRRHHGQGALDLIRERKHRMTFAHVKSGDTIGPELSSDCLVIVLGCLGSFWDNIPSISRHADLWQFNIAMDKYQGFLLWVYPKMDGL